MVAPMIAPFLGLLKLLVKRGYGIIISRVAIIGKHKRVVTNRFPVDLSVYELYCE